MGNPMGYMTEFMILNDSCGLIKTHKDEFCEKIYDACIGGQDHQMYKRLGYYPDTYSMSLGNYCNPIEVRRSHHADETRVIISGQNTMIDVTYPQWSAQYKDMAKRFPDILDGHIAILEQTVKDLKKLRTQQQSELTASSISGADK